jgi:hypothetical protein
MLNIDYGTLLILSVPGFLIGIMTGRFSASHRWQFISKVMGGPGRLLSVLGLVAYLIAILITLGIMFVYLKNFPDTSIPAYYWYTILFGVWMVISVTFELIDLYKKRTQNGKWI